VDIMADNERVDSGVTVSTTTIRGQAHKDVERRIEQQQRIADTRGGVVHVRGKGTGNVVIETTLSKKP